MRNDDRGYGHGLGVGNGHCDPGDGCGYGGGGYGDGNGDGDGGGGCWRDTALALLAGFGSNLSRLEDFTARSNDET